MAQVRKINLKDRELYKRNEKAAVKRNVGIQRIILVVIAFILILLSICTFFIDSYAYLRYSYIAAVFASLAMIACLQLAGDKFKSISIYIVYAIIVLYAVYTSAVLSPQYVCVTILVINLIFPIVFLAPTINICIAELISVIVYLGLVIHYKQPDLVSDEVVNVLCFSIIGTVVGYYARKTQLENYELEQRLRMSDEQYRLVLSHSGNIMCLYQVADMSLNMTTEVAAILNMTEKTLNVPYSSVQQGRISSESIDSYVGFYEGILNGNKTGVATFRTMTVNGWRWLKANFSTIYSDSGDAVYAVISFTDVTEQREMELAYEKWKLEVASMSGEKSCLYEWNLTRDFPEGQSGALIDLFKGLPMDSFSARTEAYAELRVHPDDKERFLGMMNIDRLIAAHTEGEGISSMEYRGLWDDGSYHWYAITVQLVSYPDSHDIKAYVIIHDIDDEKQHAIETEARARIDAVTQLLNRATFKDEVSAVLYSSTLENAHGFIMIDIDGFKGVNDTFGHLEGDNFLARVADTLRSKLRQDDLIARLGGDEFAVFMRDVAEGTTFINRVNQICSALSMSLDDTVKVSASMGVARFPKDGIVFDELYNRSDIALYEAKRQGGNRCVLYTSDMAHISYVTNATPIDSGNHES